jgi:phosphinothricin acetyltransferase
MAVIDGEQAASIKLHEGFEFVKVGHFKEIGFKFGGWLDVVYMELILR